MHHHRALTRFRCLRIGDTAELGILLKLGAKVSPRLGIERKRPGSCWIARD
jgi:hypothetical protein